jgi:hypothetical protein
MFILLDTTAILSDPLCSGTAWRVIAHAAPAWNLRVFVPEVVVAEAVAGYRRRIADSLAGLQRWGDKYAGPLGLRSVREAAEAALKEVASSYPANLRKLLNDLNGLYTTKRGERSRGLAIRRVSHGTPHAAATAGGEG